jgi:hypothetical protein
MLQGRGRTGELAVLNDPWLAKAPSVQHSQTLGHGAMEQLYLLLGG